MRSDRLAYLALTLAALFWSGNYVAGRALRNDIDPLSLNTLRWGICLVLLLPLAGRPMFRSRRIILREWRLIVLLGATGIAGFHSFIYYGLANTTAINALLISALVPVAILIGVLLTGSSRPSPAQWTGVAISLVGIAVFITRGDFGVLIGLQFNRGDAWVLAAVVMWAIYSLGLRRRPDDLPPDALLGSIIAAALVVLLPVAILLTGFPAVDLTPGAWAAVFYIAVFASLLAYRFWSYGVGEIGPERAGQFVQLMPIFGAVLSITILGETIDAVQIAGAVLVLLGILLVNRQKQGS